MNMEEANKFISPEAEAKYQRLLSKPVGKERGFLPTTDDGALLGMIREKEWEIFVSAPRRCL